MTSTKNDITKQIVSGHESGMKNVKIAKYLGVSKGFVSHVLELAGITKSKGRGRNYALDDHFFSVIDTPFKAYYLGLVFADGSVREDGYGISIALQEADRRTMEGLRRHLKTNKPLRYVVRDNPNWSNMYRLDISSRQMNADLIALGRTNDKRKLHFPSQIPDELKRHFIRGYFDADGCICGRKCKSGNGYRQWCVKINSNNPLIKEMAEYIRSEVGVSVGVYKDRGYSYMMVQGNRQTKTFLDWMYEDAPVFMDRKYGIFMDFIEYCTDSETIPITVQMAEATA